MKYIITTLLFCLQLIFIQNLSANIELPRIVSDGMVLQRNTEVKIWGWSNPGESIAVTFMDSTFKTKAGESGKWHVMLPEHKAGGPYTMEVSAGDTTATIRNIMLGEVWVSSGQSNMELPMSRVRPLYEEEIANANNEKIRYFNVPGRYDFNKPRKKLGAGKWELTTPENVTDFSAAAYFFAKKLQEQYEVPVGIINSSLGGSPAEAWVSEGTLQEKFPEYYKEAQRFKDSTLIDSIQQADQEKRASWYNKLNKKDKAYQGSGNWKSPEFDDSGWSEMEVPGYWTETSIGDKHGVVWFRKEITVPESMAGKPAKLLLGRAIDADSAFINGKFVGTTGYQYPPRRYKVEQDVLQAGKNTIVVRVINERGRGGFLPDKPYKLIAGKDTVDLTGKWKIKLGAEMPVYHGQTFIRWKPLGLFNGMIAPLLNYSIKGVIWYQGESNTDRPDEYRELFSTLIKDWRDKWNQGTFPFLYVQLANYMKTTDKPAESNWARLRDAQLKTLSVPKTGMAVTIDIGEWNDIHPLNKKDVGKRLFLQARKVAYGEDDIVHSGPIYQSMKKDGNKIKLSFKHTGSGLMAKGNDKLHHFAIAGPDKNFVWARAKIKGDKVIVRSDKVDNPVAVRYAWADNPEKANLHNKEGLPASPFRTDNW